LENDRYHGIVNPKYPKKRASRPAGGLAKKASQEAYWLQEEAVKK
jgi:hypothetical protein